MSFDASQAGFQIRLSNKEPDWTLLCDDVFNTYLEPEDIFSFDSGTDDRQDSLHSAPAFDDWNYLQQTRSMHSPTASVQWDTVMNVAPVVETRQPSAKAPATFWTKKLAEFERNAMERETNRKVLRQVKSQPDFRKPSAYPPLPAVPLSTMKESFTLRRRPSKTNMGGKKRSATTRSVSRGRPTGVVKPGAASSVNPHHVAPSNCSRSPEKLRDSPLYDVDSKDIWTENFSTPNTNLPTTFYCTTPPTPTPVRPSRQKNTIVNGAALPGPPWADYDDAMLPLTLNFQQAHIHTRGRSPALNTAPFVPSHQHYETPHGMTIRGRSPHRAPASIWPNHAPALHDMQAFDFGFEDNPPQLQSTCPMSNDMNNVNWSSACDDFQPLIATTSQTSTIESSQGLGISYDQIQYSGFQQRPDLLVFSNHTNSDMTYGGAVQSPILPQTPSQSRPRPMLLSRSPPVPCTEPRSSRRATSARRASQHRRAKSVNQSTRQAHQPSGQIGFVNLTAHDSSRILNGVAPSGSSKTKARREREQEDRNRKMNERVMRVIVDAGGDVNALNGFDFLE